MIFFSVIIPTYNRAGFIAETINSVLEQTCQDFEIIVVEDGSTDHTAEIVSTIQDKRLVYFKKENEERGAARNAGLAKARGEYAVFFDSDDQMEKNYLEILQNVIRDHPGIPFLAAKFRFKKGDKFQDHPVLQNLQEGWYGRDMFLKGNCLAANYAVRIKDHKFFHFVPDRSLASMEDWLFLLQNLEKEKIYICDRIGVNMVQHEGRSMGDNQKVIRARQLATNWALENLNLKEKEKKVLRAWSHYFCGVHLFLDSNRKLAIKETIKAINLIRVQKEFLVLLIKAILGKDIIEKIKSYSLKNDIKIRL